LVMAASSGQHSSLAFLYSLNAVWCGAVSASTRPLRVGGPMQRSGRHSSLGINAVAAFELWGKKHLAVTGTEVKFDFRDDQSDVRESAAIALGMLRENAVDVMVAPYGSTESLEVVRAVNGNLIVLVWGGASESIFEQGIPHVFGSVTTAGNYMTSGLRALRDSGADSIVLASANNAFSLGVCRGAKLFAKGLGMAVKHEVIIDDAGPTLKSMPISGADVLVGCGHQAEMLSLVLATPRGTLGPKAIIATQVATPEFLASLRFQNLSNLSCGLLMPTQWVNVGDARDPVLQWTSSEFSNDFYARTGALPAFQSASAAAIGVSLSNAIGAAGGFEDKLRLSYELHALRIPTFFGDICFNANGASQCKPMLTLQNQAVGDSLVVAPQNLQQMPITYPDCLSDVIDRSDSEGFPLWLKSMLVSIGLVVLVGASVIFLFGMYHFRLWTRRPGAAGDPCDSEKSGEITDSESGSGIVSQIVSMENGQSTSMHVADISHQDTIGPLAPGLTEGALMSHLSPGGCNVPLQLSRTISSLSSLQRPWVWVENCCEVTCRAAIMAELSRWKDCAGGHPELSFTTVERIIGLMRRADAGALIVIAPRMSLGRLCFETTDSGYLTQRLHGVSVHSAEFEDTLMDFAAHTDTDCWPVDYHDLKAHGLPKDGALLLSPEGYSLKGAAKIIGLPRAPCQWAGHGTRHETALAVAAYLDQAVVLVHSSNGHMHCLLARDRGSIALCLRLRVCMSGTATEQPSQP